MTEKQLEAKLKKEVEKLGGLCLKLVTPGFTGIPDRLILLPGGTTWFVEIKKPEGGKLSERQKVVASELEKKGFACFTVWTESGIDSVMEILRGEI